MIQNKTSVLTIRFTMHRIGLANKTIGRILQWWRSMERITKFGRRRLRLVRMLRICVPSEARICKPGSSRISLQRRSQGPSEGSSIDLLHSRFRDHTNALFKKHGMTIVGFWQPVAKPDQLIYILAYKDAAARDASWAAFQADPEWVKVRADMAVTLTVDNVFMSATDYGPIK